MGEIVEGRDIAEINQISEIVRRMLSKGDLPDDGEADQIGDAASLREVSRFPIRIKCALLAWATLEDAIGNFAP